MAIQSRYARSCEDIPYFDRIEQIRQAWKSYSKINPNKDTPEFAAMTHAKFIFLDRTIKINPFKSSHYAWIDAGLLKVATNVELIPSLTPPDKIKCLMIRYISEQEIQSESFVSACQYKIAGGFFLGPSQLIKLLCLRMITEAEYDLYQKRFGLEQEYMAIIYRRYPDLFDLYYGDFNDLFLNYHKCQRNLYLLEKIFDEALSRDDKREALKVAKYIVKSNLSECSRMEQINQFVKDNQIF